MLILCFVKVSVCTLDISGVCVVGLKRQSVTSNVQINKAMPSLTSVPPLLTGNNEIFGDAGVAIINATLFAHLITSTKPCLMDPDSDSAYHVLDIFTDPIPYM